MFGRLSIQQRLPLLICVLLLAVIVSYGFANYYSLRKATLSLAAERLSSLTSQISTSFSQSEDFLVKTSNATATQKPVIDYINSGGKQFEKETREALDKLYRDSTWVFIGLADTNLTPLTFSTKSILSAGINLKDEVVSLKPGTGKVGRIYNIDGFVYFPLISAIADNKRTIGYVISWITLRASPKSIEQFSQLVGAGASFYIGNTDGTLWTDLFKPLPTAPFEVADKSKLVEFTGEDGKPLIANTQPIAQTQWLVTIAFSEQTALQGVTTFLRWIVVIGIVLTAAGILVAWVVSRNITRPLNNLTKASTAMSQGNHLSPVSVDMGRDDELGKLAHAFNTMAADVHRTHNELERKVAERTMQLEYANKELEAFSYSVSHDLRAPLRSITGFSTMLKEDYSGKLDAKADRIINTIVDNTQTMGRLIDDLLSFSQTGKKDLVISTVNMHVVASHVTDELLLHIPKEKYNVYIAPLPPAEADGGMMKQVYMNLVGNAVKYSSKKVNPRIEIGYKQENERVIYYVRDNGAGFDMAHADKLFSVFQRLHSWQEFEGSGVGLALVKRIIEKHNGSVWAEATPNEGATFYFSL